MIKSPMFNHAVESYQHGIDHYFENSAKSRKFAILHIDHAIELFLKEKLVDSGKSIYKSDGKTLTIHEAYNSLSNVTKIPEQPRLEELHDLRNVIQHKGVVPDQSTTDFYTKFSYKFLKRFIKDEFALEIHSILPINHIVLFEAPDPIPLPEQILNAINEALESENNMSKVLGLYTAIQLAAKYLAVDVPGDERVKVKTILRKATVAHGIEESKFNSTFKYIDLLKGKIYQTDYLPTDEQVGRYENTMKTILRYCGFVV